MPGEPPQVGERWLVKDWLPLRHRVVTVDAVEPGKYLIDKGPTAPYPPDEVFFTFADGQRSSTTMTAFLRTYVREREVLARAV